MSPHRHNCSLEMTNIDRQAGHGSSSHERQQRRRRKVDGGNLDIGSERQFSTRSGSRRKLNPLTWRLSKSTLAIISFTLVESSGFSTTSTLRVLGSVIR